ncbi:hypothetical protein HNQ59_001558 [Chitinivorax tropicus]|uniref:Uncharacterized protein n=1 Tax=Chitinivorax tropicus TaxID=714531 RepID=A0A840MIN6_9PROT|nr:hypothetical protein [Chitinivorax tropicus]MBB5018270.1 hypothetical protein [Chitinivorax tropicus]
MAGLQVPTFEQAALAAALAYRYTVGAALLVDWLPKRTRILHLRLQTEDRYVTVDADGDCYVIKDRTEPYTVFAHVTLLDLVDGKVRYLVQHTLGEALYTWDGAEIALTLNENSGLVPPAHVLHCRVVDDLPAK